MWFNRFFLINTHGYNITKIYLLQMADNERPHGSFIKVWYMYLCDKTPTKLSSLQYSQVLTRRQKFKLKMKNTNVILNVGIIDSVVFLFYCRNLYADCGFIFEKRSFCGVFKGKLLWWMGCKRPSRVRYGISIYYVGFYDGSIYRPLFHWFGPLRHIHKTWWTFKRKQILPICFMLFQIHYE